MASMFIKHRVADYGKWKPAFDEDEPTRRQAGATSHTLHRDIDDPNVIIATFHVNDVARAREFVASPDLRAVMERAGVQGQPEIWITEDVEDKHY